MKFRLKLYLMTTFCMLFGFKKVIADRVCDPTRIYLNLFKVHITNNVYQESVVNFLSGRGFIYIEKIVSTFHSFRLKERIDKSNCSVEKDWSVELQHTAVISIAQDYQRVQLRTFHAKRLPTGGSRPYNVSRSFNSTEKEFLYGYSNVRYRRSLISQKDVVIGVLDNGFQMNHTNLIKAIDKFHSHDFFHNDTDPWHAAVPPIFRNDYEEFFREVSHGTMCMGIIASEGLMHCGKGFGSRVQIAGLQVLNTEIFGNNIALTSLSDTEEAKAFLHFVDDIEIVSASYGMSDNRGFLEVGDASKVALRIGVEEGRRGKGRIYVFPAGNGKKDNCNMDGYAKSIYTLTIASVTQNLQVPESDERCPCILAATAVNELFNTTAIFNTCVNGFEGSSAAVPQASAHIANMLLKNPNLTKRDVEHIIIKSATQEGFDNSVKWNTNAAGHKYNDKIGFGLINARQMFKLAEKWQQVPASMQCKTEEISTIFHIRPNCTITNLEHVEMEIEMCCQLCSMAHFGSVNIDLKSPSGTVSSLLTESKIEESKKQTQCISTALMTYEFWDETPHGEWRVNWTSRHYSGHIKLVVKKIILYGTSFDSITTNGKPTPLYSITTTGKPSQRPKQKKQPNNNGVSLGRAMFLYFGGIIIIFFFSTVFFK